MNDSRDIQRTAKPSSSPCQADDAETQLRGGISREQILTTCNELLAAERAGARLTRRLREQADGELADLLDVIHADERASCRALLAAIRAVGGEATTEIGDFETKVLALDGMEARMALLNRGQSWVLRRLRTLLDGIHDAEVIELLQDVFDRHDRNVGLADAWLNDVR
ncbi:MAG: hypothetical protein JJT88_04645 [Gammaproteobacteria bacterium]|nr:hypothetical protein [Gammaproteobacteria bacterium]